MIKKIVSNLYKSIATSSPRMEIMMRRFYWHNHKRFGKLNPYSAATSKDVSEVKHVDFEEVIKWLKIKGVKEGTLLIVHSSYVNLECTGLSAEEIVERLLKLVGPTGTLCMPVIRTYKGEPKDYDILTKSLDNLVCTYNVKFTRINTGLLPYALMARQDAVVSLHPLNPMAAVGPLAKEMMKHNLDGDRPAPHGPNSSWKFCYDHGAVVASIGVKLDHHNTIVHIVEEAFGDWKWKDEDWYRIRKFNVVDENKNTTYVEVKERKPCWGMLNFAELYYINDLKKHGIIVEDKIGGVIPVSFENPQILVNYLRSKNKNGYPYFE